MSIVPDTLGAFAIEPRVVGEGGSSTVYAARRDGQTIALKVLRADIELTDGERRRFVAEAERLARVSHPNVIRVLEAGELPRRAAVPRGPAARRRDAGGTGRARAAVARRRARVRAIHGGRARRAARRRPAPPRRQAREPVRHARRRPPRAARLRHRARSRRGALDDDAPGPHPRHADVHGAGAVLRRARDGRQRGVRARRDPPRAAGGHAAVADERGSRRAARSGDGAGDPVGAPPGDPRRARDAHRGASGVDRGVSSRRCARASTAALLGTRPPRSC